ESLAREVEADIKEIRFQLSNRYLILLLTPEAVSDESIQIMLKAAVNDNRIIIPLQVRPATLSEKLNAEPVTDISSGYHRKHLEKAIRRVEVGAMRIRRNTRIFLAVSFLGFLMFAMALVMIGGGYAEFPADEYAAEEATNLARIEDFTIPTLYYLMPRTTQDAANFDATVEAVNRNIKPLLRETATTLADSPDAIPTQDALATRRSEATATGLANRAATAGADPIND
ncbi:MAG: hypothetical protein ACPG7F_15355, partial [Aggregatilineales bacterium]